MKEAIRKKFCVVLPLEIDGQRYWFGQVVELDVEKTAGYEHALIEVEEEEYAGNG